MVIDVTTYNGEQELFEIRYNILKDYVDEFIVVEFDKTFSGKPKSQTFFRLLPKVKYHFIKEDQYGKYRELAESSSNTKGASHWKREFMQKESIKDCLTHLKDDDIVFIGDCDEVVECMFYVKPNEKLVKYKLRVYVYWLNNRSNESFWGTIKTSYGRLKNECLNHLRNNHEQKNTVSNCGWHFTSMHHQLERKLTDSYTKESYATDTVMANLDENIKQNRDFLGRDFTYRLDESDWPEYLKINREKFAHLLK